MAKYGRVENETVVEYREFAEGEIPAHKSHLWRIVEDVPPSCDSFYEILTGPVLEILEDKLVFKYTIFPRPVNELKRLVKEEAERRILKEYPLWKQNNLLNEKLNIIAKETKTVEDIARLDEITQAFDRIEYIREKSNQIEMMNPVPSDYMIEDYWE